MVKETAVEQLSLKSLARRCAQETERFFQRLAHDTRYCFELFRRAILNRNEQAWELIYRQYRSLVAGWVRRHEAYAASGEEVQYFVNRAFEKMWSAMSPDKFAKFSDLKSLLRYLQLCVHSAVVDVARQDEQSALDLGVDDLPRAETATNETAEERVVDRIGRERFWQAVEARLKTEQERRVMHGSFVLGLKPSELYARYEDEFEDVREIYRVKENLLARLRRDAALEKLLERHA